MAKPMSDKTELRKRIDEFCDENWPDEEILLFGSADGGDSYDQGFIGVGFQQHKGPVAVYDRDKCIEALAEEFARDSDDEDADPYSDAVEWFSFNTEGSWVGEKTPIIVATIN